MKPLKPCCRLTSHTLQSLHWRERVGLLRVALPEHDLNLGGKCNQGHPAGPQGKSLSLQQNWFDGRATLEEVKSCQEQKLSCTSDCMVFVKRKSSVERSQVCHKVRNMSIFRNMRIAMTATWRRHSIQPQLWDCGVYWSERSANIDVKSCKRNRDDRRLDQICKAVKRVF